MFYDCHKKNLVLCIMKMLVNVNISRDFQQNIVARNEIMLEGAIKKRQIKRD